MEDITLTDDDQHSPPSLLESVLSLLEQHTPALTLPARQRAATAFVRSLDWMESNPTAWEIKPVQPITYIDALDKPTKIVVRGRVVDIYKAVTV
jgi:hypothetical protein